MLTPKAIGDGSTYGRHVENNDYYSEGEKVTGRWQGRGAELLGLSGDVRMEDFDAVRAGA